jgi:ArsR family transcriptional regulator
MRERETDLEIYRMQAEIAKVLGHPVRLRILNLIGDREVTHGALLDELHVSKPNLSQHLGILRKAGIVTVGRRGPYLHYRLTFPEIKDLCAAMREVLVRRLDRSGRQGRLLMRLAR